MWQITEHLGPERRRMSFDEFRSQFLKVCTAHRAQGRALAFAFILFDARQPHLRDALEKDSYWDALDELSGRLLTVFSFDIRPMRRTPAVAREVMHMMVSIPLVSTNVPQDTLSTYFPGLSLEKLPCVLFFQVENDTMIASCAVSLSSSVEGPAAAYNELADVIRSAAISIRDVEDENATNARELYQLIVEGLHDRRLKHGLLSVYRGVKIVAGVAGIVRLIMTLA